MGSHDHPHHHTGPGAKHPLLAALALTLGYAVVEAAAGWWSGSLALLGDAGHMLTDALALGLAAGAAALALRPPSHLHSYGLGRAETLAAALNALLMIGIVIGISAEAVARLQETRAVDGATVSVVALIGLAVNLLAAWMLAGGRENLNVRAALLHVIGDLLGSVAALISGVVILYTGWTPVDPILSIFIGALILVSAVRVLREALHALMEGVPLHLDPAEIGETLAELDHVQSVHDLHVWSLSAERSALSAHLVLDDLGHWEKVLAAARDLLHRRFGIDHATLQPETAGPPAEQVIDVTHIRRHP